MTPYSLHHRPQHVEASLDTCTTSNNSGQLYCIALHALVAQLWSAGVQTQWLQVQILFMAAKLLFSSFALCIIPLSCVQFSPCMHPLNHQTILTCGSRQHCKCSVKKKHHTKKHRLSILWTKYSTHVVQCRWSLPQVSPPYSDRWSDTVAPRFFSYTTKSERDVRCQAKKY